MKLYNIIKMDNGIVKIEDSAFNNGWRIEKASNNCNYWEGTFYHKQIDFPKLLLDKLYLWKQTDILAKFTDYNEIILFQGIITLKRYILDFYNNLHYNITLNFISYNMIEDSRINNNPQKIITRKLKIVE